MLRKRPTSHSGLSLRRFVASGFAFKVALVRVVLEVGIDYRERRTCAYDDPVDSLFNTGTSSALYSERGDALVEAEFHNLLQKDCVDLRLSGIRRVSRRLGFSGQVDGSLRQGCFSTRMRRCS